MILDGVEQGGVLALDLGWRTIGWCLGWDERRIFGKFDLPKLGDTGTMLLAADNAIYQTLEACRPAKVVLEEPLTLYGQTDTATAKKQYGLDGIVRMEAARYSVKCISVTADLVRSVLLGQSRFPGGSREAKKACIRFCRLRGWQVRNDHEADAVLAFQWNLHQTRRIPAAAGPLWREVTY